MQELLELLLLLGVIAVLYGLIGLGFAWYESHCYKREGKPLPKQKFWKIVTCWGPMCLNQLEDYS